MFSEIWGDNIKNVGKSIQSRLDDEFKSLFRILIASIDQLKCLAKTHLKYNVTSVLDKNRKLRYRIPLKVNIINYFLCVNQNTVDVYDLSEMLTVCFNFQLSICKLTACYKYKFLF